MTVEYCRPAFTVDRSRFHHMARGFESKDVEFQQAEAAERGRPGRRALTPVEREDRSRRRTLELAVTRARAELAGADSPHYRLMLQAAIADLEARLTETAPADPS
jgi:hypothetical protein